MIAKQVVFQVAHKSRKGQIKNKVGNCDRLPLPGDCNEDLVSPVSTIGRQHAVGFAVYYPSLEDSRGSSLYALSLPVNSKLFTIVRF